METDVLVVGGGPAGLATAIAASLRGLRVTVLDSRKPPIDKTCGEGLLPEGVEVLRRLGIPLDSKCAFPLVGIRFTDDESSASAPFAMGNSYGIRRVALHGLLAERATLLGVSLLWGSRISSFAFQGVCIGGAKISFRWLVGADGQDSSVRKWAGLGPLRLQHSRFGFRRHYSVSPWSNRVEVYWGNRCQLIVTPTGAAEVCVSLMSQDPNLRIDRSLAQFPRVAEKLHGASFASAESGAVTALGKARAVIRRNVALVGDASCAVDGIAGQGLSLAFQQAACLADAIVREDLARYRSAHRQLTRKPARITRLLLAMDRSVWLRRKALRLFAGKPGLFAKAISIHTGALDSEALKAGDILGLGWRVLWA